MNSVNSGEIWWGQMGNALRLTAKLTDYMKDCRSVVLHTVSALPWKNTFYSALDIRRSGFCAERSLKRLPWSDGENPGAFVLSSELCPESVEADYWPGETYAAYLARQSQLMLNEYYVWVTGIRRKADLAQWIEFVKAYEAETQNEYSHAVFVLEYSGSEIETPAIPLIKYSTELYECRVFCLELASALNNTPVYSYQAEMALQIGGSDPELCAALLGTGEALLRDPVSTTNGVLRNGLNSENGEFEFVTQEQIDSAVWLTGITVIFPVLERFRMDFISKNEDKLRRYLPILNSNGDEIREPHDLEIGSLYYIISRSANGFSAKDSVRINLCRYVRNLLAHHNLIPYRNILELLL